MAAFISRNVVKKVCCAGICDDGPAVIDCLQVLSIEQSEGVGSRVRRSIGRPELRNFDPFLMLVWWSFLS